jgi:hypothetical protein
VRTQQYDRPWPPRQPSFGIGGWLPSPSFTEPPLSDRDRAVMAFLLAGIEGGECETRH